MNKMHLFVLGLLSVIVICSMVSFTAAASIARTSASSVPSQEQQYVVETSPCSTIARSYTSCQRISFPTYAQPRADSSYGATRLYMESPGENLYPQENTRINRNAEATSTNFDTTTSAYDYRGPMYERRIIATDDFLHENSAKSRFFSSNNKDITTRSIRNEVVEKYVGATESLYKDSKNNRVATQHASDMSTREYDGGFSFGKQRLFDEIEYGRDSYTGSYYYRPMIAPSGY